MPTLATAVDRFKLFLFTESTQALWLTVGTNINLEVYPDISRTYLSYGFEQKGQWPSYLKALKSNLKPLQKILDKNVNRVDPSLLFLFLL